MAELKFAETHEWIKIEDGKGKIGITEHAQDELGDIVFVELPDIGKDIEKGESFGVVESVKVASDLYAPCTGKIIAVNSELQSNPQLINEDAFGKGWIIEIEISNEDELNDLLNESEYKEMI